MNRKELARIALRGALDLRIKNEVSTSLPVCVFDFAQKVGIDVRFIPGKSFGGMFSKTTNTILVPTLRPPGRRAMTCAHELGHWYFDHGARVELLDEYSSDDSDEEYLARLFGHYFMMPPRAVRQELSLRKLNPQSCSANDIYKVANQLGIAYEALIRHLANSMMLISRERAKELLSVSPKSIRANLLEETDSKHLVFADHHWHEIPIDLEVGDHVILPPNTIVSGSRVQIVREEKIGTIALAQEPGISSASNDTINWSCFIRVCRREFAGLSMYRHLEEVTDEAALPSD